MGEKGRELRSEYKVNKLKINKFVKYIKIMAWLQKYYFCWISFSDRILLKIFTICILTWMKYNLWKYRICGTQLASSYFKWGIDISSCLILSILCRLMFSVPTYKESIVVTWQSLWIIKSGLQQATVLWILKTWRLCKGLETHMLDINFHKRGM